MDLPLIVNPPLHILQRANVLAEMRGFVGYKGKWKVPESLKGAQDCIRKVWRLMSLH